MKKGCKPGRSSVLTDMPEKMKLKNYKLKKLNEMLLHKENK
jgi:hypothetical protein